MGVSGKAVVSPLSGGVKWGQAAANKGTQSPKALPQFSRTRTLRGTLDFFNFVAPLSRIAA